MTKFSKLVLVSLGFVSALGFSEDLKIGASGPYSGDLEPLGTASFRAAKLVFDQVNEAGGVLGKKIVLTQKDDECDGTKAAAVAKEFVAEKTLFVIGHNCSGASLAALPAYKEASILAFSSSATNPGLTQSGNFPNFFRSVASDDLQGKLQVDYTATKLGLKKFAIVHDQEPYGTGLADNIEQNAKKVGGVEIAFREQIKSGEADYAELVKKIVAAAPDVVFYGGNHPEAAKIVVGLRAAGSKILFVSGDGTRTAEFIKAAGASAEGTLGTAARDHSKNPEAVKAKAHYKKVYGDENIGEFFYESYSNSLALVNAIAKAGSVDSAKVSEKLRSEKIASPIGPLQYDKKGDTVGAGFSVYRVVDGKWVELNTRR